MSLNDLQLLLADVAIVVILAWLLGTAARWLGQPPVLGEILAGILLGPTFLHGRITATLFPAAEIAPLTALADLGLVLFMFVVGYELDLRLIRGRERVAFGVSAGSVALPLILGAGLGVWLAHRHHVPHVATFALFIGTAMAATAFPVLARILTDRGLHRTRIGGIALASAATADVLAWTLLAVVVALAGTGGQWRVLLALPYAAAMFVIVRPLLGRLARVYRRAGQVTPDILATGGVATAVRYVTNWIGLHFIFGSFLFGSSCPARMSCAARGDPRTSRAAQRAGAAPAVLRRVGAERHLIRHREFRVERARRDPGGRGRREADRRLPRRPADRGPRPQRRGDRDADEHPGPDRTGHSPG